MRTDASFSWGYARFRSTWLLFYWCPLSWCTSATAATATGTSWPTSAGIGTPWTTGRAARWPRSTASTWVVTRTAAFTTVRPVGIAPSVVYSTAIGQILLFTVDVWTSWINPMVLQVLGRGPRGCAWTLPVIWGAPRGCSWPWKFDLCVRGTSGMIMMRSSWWFPVYVIMTVIAGLVLFFSLFILC